MLTNIFKIFESLAYCRDGARVVINPHSTNFPIKVDDSWLYGGRSMRYYSPSTTPKSLINEQNTKTNLIFIDCIKEFVGEGNVTGDIESLIGRFQKRATKCAPLTAGKIRFAYKTCIAHFLEGYRKIAVFSRDTDRVILETVDGQSKFTVHNVGLNLFNSTIKEENRKVALALKEALVAEWGSSRLSRAQTRHQIDLDLIMAKGDTIRVGDINRLIIGLADYFRGDINDCWVSLNKIMNDGEPLTILPHLTLRKLAKVLNKDVSDQQGIIDDLKAKYDLGASPDALSPEVFAFLQHITLLDSKELELSFQGRRLEGVVDGLRQTLSSFFIFYPEVEDLERLHMYQRILDVKYEIQESELESFYDEILIKGLVKKKMEAGMLIPTPWKERQDDFEAPCFYEIWSKLRTGYAKLGYHLTPTGNLKKDYLIFRSTSSAPSADDALSTVITGLFPMEPVGYLWRRVGANKEKDVLNFSDRPLRIIGHSLGGSHSQLFMLNRIKRLDNDQFEDDLPDREYEIVPYDSPKIKLNCVKDFAKWLDSDASLKLRNKISITHHTSKGDPVPFLGEAYLGAEADESKLKSLKVIKLIPKEKNNPNLNYHPHACHYYRTEKNKDFIEQEIPINKTTSRKWHLIEVIRRIVGFILFPILWLYNAIKTWVFGFGQRLDGELSKVWEKIYPKPSVA